MKYTDRLIGCCGLDSAGCEDTEITWGSELVKAVEAILQAAGMR